MTTQEYKNWLRDNLWNLVVTAVGIIIAFTTIQNRISYLEVRAQTNYDRITKLEVLIEKLPDKEELILQLDPIKSDVNEIKTDLKKHLLNDK